MLTPEPTPSLFDDVETVVAVPTPPAVLASTPNAKVTAAYDAWWWFAYERQRIYYRRLDGEQAPWTEDPTLKHYRFTNAYRAADRVSQYLIRDVIYRDGQPQDPDEVVFRILLFKLFNRIETWEALTAKLGLVTLADTPFERIDEILTAELEAGRQIYSAAYIMPTSRAQGGTGRKHQMHLTLLRQMMDDRLGNQLAETTTMQSGFDLLRAYPMIGDFLAYQFITDINYSNVVNYREDEFVAAGPGAREGLRKCFADPGNRSDEYLIRMMMEKQDEEFARLGLDFRDLFGRPLQLIDCQNIFCEVSKYARVRFPTLTPPGGRARIKQKYQPTGTIERPFFPPKWGINDAVSETFPTQDADQKFDLGRYQKQARKTSLHMPVQGGDAITTPMFGLIGEAGEVVSELKKRAREGSAYVGFRDRLAEELGDLLWYVADLARRRDLDLAELDFGNNPGGQTDGPGQWIRPALSLTAQIGKASRAYGELLEGHRTDRGFNIALRHTLRALMADLRYLARQHDLSLGDIAEANLHKVNRRWTMPEDAPPPDRTWPDTEQLPPRFDALIADQDGRVSICFEVGGERIPATANTLTDNAYDPDGYRFHDIFHFAYAAVLDWSPVTRSLLCRKRKSDPRIDEVEDGGRAVAIEEGISAMVFAYASQHRMLEGVKTIEDSVLRTIRDMTGHLEVRTKTAAEWQDAILQGFDAWRHVRAAGGGCVRVDGTARRTYFLEPAALPRITGDLFQ